MSLHRPSQHLEERHWNGERFWFDAVAADRACAFFETHLHLIESEWFGKPFILMEWARHVVRELFGWKREDGTRQYRTAYIEIPRKNAKSTLAAGLALYLLLCDGEARPQVFVAAGDRGQANTVFNMAKKMVAMDEVLTEHARPMQYKIIERRTDGYMEALSADADLKHGLNAHAVIYDEVHVAPNAELWDVLATSMGSRRQPLMAGITTAGNGRTSVCWKMHCRAEEAIAKPEKDPYFFAVIYGAHHEEDWTSEEVWRKANPGYGISLKPEYFREKVQEALSDPEKENTFRQLHLNQWTEQAVRFIPMFDWDKCVSPLDEESLNGRPCYVGLDLASTRDISALVGVFPLDDDYFALLPRLWVPEEAIDPRAASDRKDFLSLIRSGHIRTTNGNETDYGTVLDAFMSFHEQFDVRSLYTDPWNGAVLGQQIVAAGFPDDRRKRFAQNGMNYTAPLGKLKALVKAHKLVHGCDPALRWMASNFAIKKWPDGNMQPDKGKASEKIDGIVATLMGLAGAMNDPNPGGGTIHIGEIQW